METSLPSEMLSDFYSTNNLSADGGQGSPTVKIQLAEKFAIYFPNFDSRRRAVIRHDVHHLLTGYSASTLAGESEISAWEIASGCKKHRAAFFINISGVMIGVLFNFRNQLKAFARGRRTKNLYADEMNETEFLQTPVATLKNKLLLDRFPADTKAGIADLVLFLLFLLFGLVYSILILPLFPLLLLYSLYVVVSGKR